jgi:hypothetical protein
VGGGDEMPVGARPGRPGGRLRGGLLPIDLELRHLRAFLEKGIGDQLAYHVLDAAFPFTTEVSGFMGAKTPLGELTPMGNEMLGLGLLAQSLTHPVCAMIPVTDDKIVDAFLGEIDKKLAELARREIEEFIKMERYQVMLGRQPMRIYAIKVMGITLRICWARMGNMLVIANQPQVIEELAGQLDTARPQPGGTVGHALFRVRPENWNAVLPSYRLGWEEAHRSACEINQQRIANVARGYPELVKPDGSASPELMEKVKLLYGVRPFCPDGGTYQAHAQHSGCRCSIHGDRTVGSRQLMAPTQASATAKTLSTFKGLTATLTFLDDGLHAVVTIQRK